MYDNSDPWWKTMITVVVAIVTAVAEGLQSSSKK